MPANLYLHQGERALSDFGARRDLAQSLALGAARHLRDVARGTGRELITVYIDEPDAGAVLNGTLPTASGYRTLRSVPVAEVRSWWTELTEALKDAGAHQVILGGGGEPETWNRVASTAIDAGVDGLGVNASDLTVPGWELLAGAVEAGRRLWLGCLAPDGTSPGVVEAVATIRRPWNQLGLSDALLDALVLTPTEGLAGVAPEQATAVLSRLSAYADALNQVRVDA